MMKNKIKDVNKTNKIINSNINLNQPYIIRLLDEHGKQGEVIGVVKGFETTYKDKKFNNVIKTKMFGKRKISVLTNLNQVQWDKISNGNYLNLSTNEKQRLKSFI